MALSVKLQRLLVKADLWHHGTFCLHLWFDGCELEKQVLMCPTREHKTFIERNFLMRLRQAVPDLLVIVPAAPNTTPSGLKSALVKDQDLFR